nr:amino acid adenylation domain-containing protein [Ktedonobacteraceae bacterium]
MTTTSVFNTQAGNDYAVFPASFAQQRLWFLDQLQVGNTAYNLCYTLYIHAPLNMDALEQSLHALVQRHETLRTTFVVQDGQPMQAIASTLTIPLPLVDLQALPQEHRQTEVLRLATQQAQQPFDLARGPLLRATVFQLEEANYLLFVVVHNIIFDGWSKGVFFRELETLYQARVSQQAAMLPDLPIQYANFAAWQRDWLKGPALADQLTYWKTRLANAPSVLELPTDHPRPPIESTRGASYFFTLPQPLSKAVQAMSQQEGVSLFTTLAAAFQTLLSRYSGQQDILLGTVSADRGQAETKDLIGFLVNTLVLRTDLSGNPTFRDLLGRVREGLLQAQKHQDVPFEYLVKELQPDRSSGQNPFFQVMLAFEPLSSSSAPLPQWTLSTEDIQTGAAKFDLSLELEDRQDGLHGRLEYRTDLFEEATIRRLIGHWQTLLEGIVAHPEQPIAALPLLPEAERQQVLVDWNATQSIYPTELCIHQVFEAQVELTPEACAVVFDEQEVSYRDLNRRANQLAHHLRQLGVGPEVLVGLCVDRSIEMVVGLLGILKAGGAYVPLDPTFPSERLAFMLEDSQTPVLVTQQHLVSRLPQRGTTIVCLDTDAAGLAQQDERNATTLTTAENLAYVIYTSGSTGKPKGVQIPHRAVVNFLLSMGQQPGLSAEDRWLAVTTLSFDIAALEIFLPLIVGACVIIASRDVVTSGTALAETMARMHATVMQATPVTWRMMLAEGWQGDAHLKVLCGGEALPPELAQQLRPKVASLWNLYGPTETTIWSTVCQIEREDNGVTIGRPIANTQIYILSPQLQPMPIGVPGELYIGGDGLARGYLNRPELTAERFIRHPFSNEPGTRIYKTGDLARYRPDGTIEHLGRLDYQVKMRGFRIELGEIEAVLSQHPAVQQAVVVAREDVPGDKRLVAYVVLAQQQSVTANELQQHTMQQLPQYMVPSAIVFLETLPLTPNKKVDRGRLPKPEQSRDEALVAPRTPLEETVAGIWSQMLGIERIGVHDNFFALGGHSLLAMQVISRLHTTLQVEVSLRSFFEVPTVAQLTEVLERLKASGTKSQMPKIRSLSREAHRTPLSK